MDPNLYASLLLKNSLNSVNLLTVPFKVEKLCCVMSQLWQKQHFLGRDILANIIIFCGHLSHYGLRGSAIPTLV